MTDYSHLWNNLPLEERKRLMPFQMQTQIQHLKRSKEKAVKAHRQYIKEMNDWIENLERELRKYDK